MAKPRLHRPTTTQIVVALVLLSIISAVGMFLLSQNAGEQIDTTINDKNAVVEKGTQQSDSVLSVCARGGEAGKELAAVGACKDAQDFKNDPVVQSAAPATNTTIVQQLPDAQVQRILEDYFARNNPKPSVTEVLDLLNRIYRENPPKDAPAVTEAQRAADVAAFCADGRCRGEAGKDATPEMVAAQVADYCGQPSEPCRGPQGDPGKVGPEGKQGPEGQPGPICESGYHPEDLQSADDPPKTLRVCVKDTASEPPTTETTVPPTS